MNRGWLDRLSDHIRLLYVVLTLLTFAVLLLTLLPTETFSDSALFQYNKIGHILMFGSWTFFLGLLLYTHGQKPLPLFSIFLAGSLFGISVEILQEVLPTNRTMDPWDMAADVFGSLVAVLVLRFLTKNDRYP